MIPGWYQPPAETPPPCRHRFLTLLEINFCGGLLTPFFIPIENLSSLEVIDIRGLRCVGAISRKLLDLHRAHPFKHLRRLNLADLVVNRGHIMEVIRSTPTIDHLCFNYCRILSDDFLSSLIVSTNRPLLLPRLLLVHIIEWSPTDVKDETILELVKSRWIGGENGLVERLGGFIYQIAYVRVDDKRAVNDTTLKELRAIREGGLNLEIPGLVEDSSEEEDEGEDDD
ncbi:hypothetical protein BDN72DRAFT_902879 [Pluteus cervinus]|uniref:Uncharacterized protein n=1 Tax=Pluteus cervinus TaxID=181527 RepID=A0ACD3ADE7_9AGAR|nr:hypothetical protein BDN72DRAFT_902879 [Pluteus cervinus]